MSTEPVSTEPVLRRDAARNRAKILAAARTVFDESGVDVCVETIAQRAGVGVGTLYRRFPTKDLLIDAVVDEVLRGVPSAADAALANDRHRPTASPSTSGRWAGSSSSTSAA